MNYQQQQQFTIAMTAELEKITMSWDNDLRRWHPSALHALHFASARALNIRQSQFIDLLKSDVHGVNMTTVAVLCNNIESCTPEQLRITPTDYGHLLLLNQRIAERWEALAAPVRDRVMKRFQIMQNNLKPIIRAEA